MTFFVDVTAAVTVFCSVTSRFVCTTSACVPCVGVRQPSMYGTSDTGVDVSEAWYGRSRRSSGTSASSA